MKAAVIKKPGQIILEDVAKPSPGRGEVLLKVDACAICGTDQRVLNGEKHVDVPIVGHEIVGTVEEVGEGVDPSIRVGYRYDIQTVIGCGTCSMCKIDRQNLCENGFTAIGYQYNGGFAEYMIMPENGVKQGCLIPIPDEMPADTGTLIEPLSCCINGMRPIPFEHMDQVVIFGGGIIGTLNGLVAKARGVGHVTIMDISQDRLDLLGSMNLPFDHYVNTADIDPVEWVKSNVPGGGVEAVVVAASVKSLVTVGLKLLKRDGHLSIFAGMPKSNPIEPTDMNLIHYNELHLHGANSSVFRDYVEARELLTSGKIDGTSLITHYFTLDDFLKAVETQKDPSAGSLKIIINP